MSGSIPPVSGPPGVPGGGPSPRENQKQIIDALNRSNDSAYNTGAIDHTTYIQNQDEIAQLAKMPVKTNEELKAFQAKAFPFLDKLVSE